MLSHADKRAFMMSMVLRGAETVWTNSDDITSLRQETREWASRSMFIHSILTASVSGRDLVRILDALHAHFSDFADALLPQLVSAYDTQALLAQLVGTAGCCAQLGSGPEWR